MSRIFTCLLLATFGLVASSAQAATADGTLRMEVITAYNFVVDSNIESPAGKSPSAAHLGVKIYNDGPTALTNVVVNIGNMTSPGSGTPGVFDSRTIPAEQNVGGLYAGTFQLEMPGGAPDAVRVIPRIEPGEYVAQYFFVKYPLVDSLNRSVTGSAPVVEDDLWLNYDIWASANESGTPRQVDQRTTVTMRNEISAMANKIWPNGDNKVPDEYLSVIESFLGWRPSTETARIPGAEVKEGIWYDLGNVGAGFDNNGDGIPDRNAWLQPVGDPSQFDPLGARMVKCYGIVIVKLNDGTEKLIPFEDDLYFENVPANNTGAVGLVYYEFLPLDASRTTHLTPYQEVASGYDNEKFNADYGTVTGSGATRDPEAEIVKTGPTTRAIGQNADYTLATTNIGTLPFGWPDLGLPVVIEDPIPTGLQYVANSATTAANVTNPAGGVYTVFYSTDDGVTWSNTQPTPATLVNRLRWVLDRALQPGDTATVAFSATVPTGFTGVTFTNIAILKAGTITEVDRDTWTTLLTGNNSVGDFVWKDLDRDGVQDGGSEIGISNVGVSLYVDSYGDGTLDSGDPLYSTTTTNGSGIYGFSNLPDGKYIVVVDQSDVDLPLGYTLPNSATTGIAVSLDPTSASSTAVSDLTADWPFIPALEVIKSVTPTTYGAGELVDFTIDLENHSAPVAAKSIPEQISWSTTVDSAANRRAAQLPTNAQGIPNNAYAFLDWSQGSDSLTTSSGYTFLSPTGTITKVELLIYGYLNTSLTNDTIDVILGATTLSDFIPTATINTWTGSPALRVVDITSNVALDWTALQALTVSLQARSQNSKDNAILYVDSIGIRVTTNATTPSSGTYGSTSIAPLPLTDTFDNTKLAYVSASEAPTSVSGGTIIWADLGPLNAGVRKTITVTFRTLTTVSTTTTTNTVTATNAYFVSGRRTNDDSGAATITITPRASIGDRVWWDLNANGAQDLGEPGLQNVLVMLSNGARARTDINGNYLFPGLVAGSYTVTIDPNTLPSGFTQTYDADGVTPRPIWENSVVTITTNDNLLQDFGYDSALNVITGTIFEDNNGDGLSLPTLQSGENYLSGLTATLLRDADNNGTFETMVGTTTTDSSGYYAFSSLADGSYQVVVTQPDFTTQTLDPDVTINNSTNVAASGGNLYPDKNFAYRPSGALTLGDTLYYDWNGNGTQDNGEGGIANVDVFLYEDSNGNGLIDAATDAFIGTSVTNVSGVYSFSSLVAGNYLVVVNTADPQFPANVTQKQDLDGVPDSKAAVSLVTSRSDVDFGYQPLGTGVLGNLIWLDANNDGIKDTTEYGINGVTVELYFAGQTPGVSMPYATTTTSGGGLYSFSSLPLGSYVVYLPASNFTGGGALVAYPMSSSATDTADNQQDDDDNGSQSAVGTTVSSPTIALSSGETDNTVDFGFMGTASIGDTVFYDLNANGTLDYSETGINGVIVELYLDADDDNIADGAFIATATTATVGGVSGFYEFTDLAPNRYIVKVRTSTLPAGVTQTADPDLDGIPVNNTDDDLENDGDHADTDIVLFSGSDYRGADFGYQPPGAIGDYVWLDIDRDGVQDIGEPGIAGVVVRVDNGSGTFYDITTDADGYWGKAVADGTWTVSVPTAPIGMINTYDADSGIISPNASVTVTVSAGVVTVPSGLAQGNMGLDFGFALNGDYGLSGTLAINDTGVIGKHTDIDDFIDDSTDLDAGPNDETELPGVLVYLYTSTGTFLGSTYTDSAGNYAFTNLPDGIYRVIIGTTTPPLDRATLTTTNGNYSNGTTVTDTGTTVIQQATIAGASLVDIDFMFDSDVDYDLGDLPSSYPMTSLTQDGARHIIPNGGSTLYMGTAPDLETNGAPSLSASSDDLSGSDDEDGLTVNASTWVDGTNAGSVSVEVTGSGWLVAWIDWNHDGDFLDADEMIADRAVSTGSVALTFNIPAGTIAAGSESWFSRFRLFPSQPEFSVFAYVGEASGGEVEDHLIEKTSGGSIGDLLWADADGDGVIDSGEAGIGGMLVQLRDSGGTNVLATQTTSNGTQDVDGDGVIDPMGYYRFRDLSAATYNIVVPTAPAGYSVSYDENSGTTNPDGATQVVLAADEQHLTADFGYVPAVANISGHVYFDTDTDTNFSIGDTSAGFVRVQLFTDPNGDGNPSDGVQVRETYTNASGYYEFLAVPSGNYVVVEVNPLGTTSLRDVVDPQTDDRIPVVMVGNNITGRDFLDTQPPIYDISGTVYDDAPANNNSIDGADIVLSGVTVKLYLDRDGNGLVSAGDTELDSTITDSNGDYSFTGLVAGSYVVQKTNPAGDFVTNDWDASADLVLTDSEIAVVLTNADATERNFLIDGYLGAITGSVAADTDNNGSGDFALETVILSLVDGSGNPILDGSNQPITTVTAANGTYSFINLVPGTYGVVETQPVSYVSLSDKDMGVNLDEIRPITVVAGETNTLNDFVEISRCPDTWADWKQLHPSETATGNPDLDSYANFTEFAFAMPYNSGTGSEWLDHTAWIVQESTIAPGTVEGVFIRPTGAYLNVVYTLEYAAVIGSPNTSWTTIPIPVGITVTPNGDCTETVTIHDLAAVTGLTNQGVVRLKAVLDDDGGNNEVDLTTYTETEGWTITNCAVCCQSYNNPYARESVFTGTIGAVSGQQISFTGEQLLGNILEVGASYYIEVETGTHEGHRYDVTSTGAGSVTLAIDSNLYAATAPFNTTMTAPPETLVGAKIALRRHWKLGEMFPPLDHVATGSQATADQVQIFVQGAWKIYWLYNQNDVDPDTAIWVDAVDVEMAVDQAGVIIPPGQGMLFNNRGVARTQLSYGEIRLNDFIRPLPIGRSFVGGGYPLDQSAAGARGRQMTKAVGFFGSRDFTTADSFFLWNADTISQGRSYSTYFLHEATPKVPALIRWVVVGDNVIAIRDAEVHFKADRAVFIRTKNGLSSYTIPSPWAP